MGAGTGKQSKQIKAVLQNFPELKFLDKRVHPVLEKCKFLLSYS